MAAMAIRIALAVLSAQIAPGATEIQLLPAGEFRAVDGRPAGLPAWKLDAAAAGRVIAAARVRANPFVIDYEHQTLLADKNGQPAPAAGWFSGADLVWREGQGLFATNPAWTAKAKAHIAAQEYKFISPVFEFDAKTGEIQAIKMAALTNTPGLDGMDPVSGAALAALFSPTSDEETAVNETLKKLLGALGLPETTSEADALAGVAALKAQSVEHTTQIAALKAAAPDPAKYVAVATVMDLQGQIAALTAEKVEREVNELVKSGMDDGRILPAMETWARELGKKDTASLKSYLDNAKSVAALGGMQSTGTNTGTPPNTSDADLAVCKALGLTPEQFAKGKIKE